MGKKTFLFGAAVGAAAMYLFDPNNGEQRRLEAQQKAREVAESPTGQKAADKAQQAAGQAIEATRGIHDRGPGDDNTLADKVRSEVLGRPEFSDVFINVDANDGTVVLRGVVDDWDRRNHLIEQVRAVGGVDTVQSYLHASNEPAPSTAAHS